MKHDTPICLISILQNVKEPRVERTRKHNIVDILFISLCAAMCGMKGWEDIETFAKIRLSWFRKFVPLKNGVPSHDTLRRVFERIDPKQLQCVLKEWLHSFLDNPEGKVIAIDGKTLRSSFDNFSGKKALHMVSAWVTDNNLSLGQTVVDSKHNEITAIPELLDLIEIKGATVTIDAMGCQKEITRLIVNEKKADYILALKKNHPDLHSEVEAFFRVAADRSFSDFQTNTWTSTSKGHGRIETRTCTTLLAEQWLDHVAQGWTKLTTIVQMVSEREIGGKKTSETRYYISSLGNNAKEMAHGIRAHWKIENTLHWCLDVTYGEDACRIRKDNAPANFAIIRRIAHSLVMARKPKNMSVPKVQLNALLNADFMNEYLISD